MNKTEIKKIESFFTEVNQLPDYVLSNNDIETVINNVGLIKDQDLIHTNRSTVIEKFEDIRLRLLAYFRAVEGSSSIYIDLIERITFEPILINDKPSHLENNKAWLANKLDLLKLLKMAKVEFEEKARIEKENPENSILKYFKSKKGIGALFVTLLTIIAGIVTKDIWFIGFTSDKIRLSQSDSILRSDKAKVVEMVRQETFIKCYQTIKKLRDNYAPVNALRYIKEFIQDDTANIKIRIENKSYIHRFASYENLWSDADYLDVSNLISSKTLHRFDEIFEDIKSSAKGAFIMTDEKLQMLEEQVLAEIKN